MFFSLHLPINPFDFFTFCLSSLNYRVFLYFSHMKLPNVSFAIRFLSLIYFLFLSLFLTLHFLASGLLYFVPYCFDLFVVWK